MKRFNKAVCIDDHDPRSTKKIKSVYITKGNIYEIVRIYRDHCTIISDYHNKHVTYYKSRFRPIYNLNKLKLL